VLALTISLPAVARADDHEGKLVLKVDGKDVTLKLAGGSYGSAEGDAADHFGIGGEKVVLAGRFDLNGDGKTNGKDRLPVSGDDEIVKPTSALNKPHPLTPTAQKSDEEAQANFVELPGLGRMEVLKGSTLTLTRFRVTDGIKDRWAGTVRLVVKGENGQKVVTGTFDCGTGAE
jgi:hypothetical protein